MSQNLPWQNQQPLTIDQIKQIIAQQFAILNPLTIKPIGEGWDNTAWFEL